MELINLGSIAGIPGRSSGDTSKTGEGGEEREIEGR